MSRLLIAVAVSLLLTAPSLVEAKSATAKAKVTMTRTAGGEMLPAPVCCPDRCVIYKHHRPCKKACCTCAPPVQTVLLVEDPCVCGCLIEVPICLPACCVGEPKVCNRNGFLGRDVVEYEWCCGYRVKMVFTKRGDLVVHTFGS